VITSGPDGALWFTNAGNNSIGRITTSGTVTNYTDPSIDDPYGITSGPDGALWFTNAGNNSIGRITTSGTVTNYTGSSIDDPNEITTGPDGALWFTNYKGNSIGRVTTSGVVSSYTGAPTVTASPSSGKPGGLVTASGTGFGSGENVKVTYKTGLSAPNPTKETICASTVGDDTSFTCTGQIPARTDAGSDGAHTVKAKGGSSMPKTKAATSLTLTSPDGSQN
jgi:hypothetical protein